MRNSHYHQCFCFVSCMDERLQVKARHINVVVSRVRWAQNLCWWLFEPILHVKIAGKCKIWSNNTNGGSVVPVMVLFTFSLLIISVTYFKNWINLLRPAICSPHLSASLPPSSSYNATVKCFAFWELHSPYHPSHKYPDLSDCLQDSWANNLPTVLVNWSGNGFYIVRWKWRTLTCVGIWWTDTEI